MPALNDLLYQYLTDNVTPTTAQILSACAVSTGTIITIPANKTWVGSLTIVGNAINSSTTGGATAQFTISSSSSGVVIPQTTALFQVPIITGVANTGVQNAAMITATISNVVIAAGTAAASLFAYQNGASALAGTWTAAGQVL